MPSILFFFPKIAVPMSVNLVPYEFGDYLFFPSVENVLSILIGIALNL